MSEGQDEAPESRGTDSESAGMTEREAEGIMTEAETLRQIKEGNKERKNKSRSLRRRGGGQKGKKKASQLFVLTARPLIHTHFPF